MATVKSETKTAYVVRLNQAEADTLASVLLAVRWEGKFGKMCEAIHEGLTDEGAEFMAREVKWDNATEHLVVTDG